VLIGQTFGPMVKHIVMLRLKDSAHGNDKLTNARLIKQKLEALRGQIPGVLVLEVGLDWSATEQSADLVIYSEFEFPPGAGRLPGPSGAPGRAALHRRGPIRAPAGRLRHLIGPQRTWRGTVSSVLCGNGLTPCSGRTYVRWLAGNFWHCPGEYACYGTPSCRLTPCAYSANDHARPLATRYAGRTAPLSATSHTPEDRPGGPASASDPRWETGTTASHPVEILVVDETRQPAGDRRRRWAIWRWA
jgi:hypothetical protein